MSYVSFLEHWARAAALSIPVGAIETFVFFIHSCSRILSIPVGAIETRRTHAEHLTRISFQYPTTDPPTYPRYEVVNDEGQVLQIINGVKAAEG